VQQRFHQRHARSGVQVGGRFLAAQRGVGLLQPLAQPLAGIETLGVAIVLHHLLHHADQALQLEQAFALVAVQHVGALDLAQHRGLGKAQDVDGAVHAELQGGCHVGDALGPRPWRMTAMRSCTGMASASAYTPVAAPARGPVRRVEARPGTRAAAPGRGGMGMHPVVGVARVMAVVLIWVI
jgi:hypothetical protein